MCFCISTILVRQNNALIKAILFYSLFKAILKCPFLRENNFCETGTRTSHYIRKHFKRDLLIGYGMIQKIHFHSLWRRRPYWILNLTRTGCNVIFGQSRCVCVEIIELSRGRYRWEKTKHYIYLKPKVTLHSYHLYLFWVLVSGILNVFNSYKSSINYSYDN